MKTIKPISLLLLILFIFLNGCIEEEKIIQQISSKQILAIVTDFESESDVMVHLSGLIYSNYPDVNVVHIQTSSFDIQEAAYRLQTVAESYPEGAYFVGMIEPGSAVPRLAFKTDDNKTFLVPDNGVASRIFHYMNIDTYYKVDNSSIFDGSDPQTLYFEEFYTKAILFMLAGESIADFGDVFTDPVTLSIQEPAKEGETILGQILITNNFGNCMTNINDTFLSDFSIGDLLEISAGDISFFATFGTSYSSVPSGQNVILIDSSDYLKMAVCYDSLAERYLIGAGTHISIEKGVAQIGILQFSDLSDSLVDEMTEQLENEGLSDGNNAIYYRRNAGGDFSVLQTLATELAAKEIDVMVAWSTPASQAAVISVPEEIPIIFTIITDPYLAGLFDGRNNITGLSDGKNYNDYMNFVKRLFPDISVVGSIYNENEPNSVYAQQQLSLQASLHGIEFKTATITDISDLDSAYTQILNQNIEAVITTDDNTIASGMANLLALTNIDNIPVIGADSSNAKDGALASIGVDYELIGRSTGDLVLAILRGVEPDEESIKYFSSNVISINTATADLLGYTYSQDIVDEASFIYP